MFIVKFPVIVAVVYVAIRLLNKDEHTKKLRVAADKK